MREYNASEKASISESVSMSVTPDGKVSSGSFDMVLPLMSGKKQQAGLLKSLSLISVESKFYIIHCNLQYCKRIQKTSAKQSQHIYGKTLTYFTPTHNTTYTNDRKNVHDS